MTDYVYRVYNGAKYMGSVISAVDAIRLKRDGYTVVMYYRGEPI